MTRSRGAKGARRGPAPDRDPSRAGTGDRPHPAGGQASGSRSAAGESRPIDRAATMLEAGVLLTASLVLALVHLQFLFHAGGFWRDEVNSLEFARTGSISELVSSLRYDSFPILFSLILRAWSTAPWAGHVEGIRLLGWIVGILVLGVLWANARLVGRTFPCVSIPLFGFNLVALRATDAIRPYGLGLLAVLVLFGAVWKVASDPSPAWIALAVVAAVASVQSLYTNAFFVLSICAAGAWVCLRRGSRTRALVILLAGAVAALSLVPYRTAIAQAGEWAGLNRFPASLERIVSVLSEALGTPTRAMVMIWGALIAFGLARALGARVAGNGPREVGTSARDARTYAAATLVLSAPLFIVVLWAARFPTQPWYYVPLMGLAATTLDVLLGGYPETAPARLARPVAAAAVVLVCIVSLWRGAHVRQTNMDVVAARLEESASKEDLILVNPWYFGVSFHHAYRGAAHWLTVPPLADLRIHRYDLLKSALQSQAALGPVLSAVTGTLGSGRRVWLVGGLPSPPQGRPAPELPPAPLQGAWTWQVGDYLGAFGMQTAAALQKGATGVEAVSLPTEDPVSPYENVTLFQITGRTPPPSP